MARISLIVDSQQAVAGFRQAEAAGRRFEQSARQIGGATDQLRGSFGRLTNAIFSVQGALAGIGVGLGIQQAVQQFSEFESGLVAVGKPADLTQSQMDQLGNRIDEISRRVPVAGNRLLELASAAGQVGVSGVDNIAKFTETIAKLETATDLAGEQGARSLARPWLKFSARLTAVARRRSSFPP